MKKLSKIIALVLAVSTLVTVFAVNASAATWKTGNVPSNSRDSGYTTVCLSNTRKAAKIKIHAYYTYVSGGKGYEGNSRFYVTMRSTSGKWIWGGEIDTGRFGKSMTLGNDHYAYRIYIREVRMNGLDYYRVINPYHYPSYFAIECTSNCYIN